MTVYVPAQDHRKTGGNEFLGNGDSREAGQQNFASLSGAQAITDLSIGPFGEETGSLFEDVAESPEIVDYVNRYAGIVDLVVETAEVLKEYFPDSELYLSHKKDPEFESEGELVVTVKTGLSAKQAHQRLDQFDTRWWLGNDNKHKNKVSVLIEFI